jgi:hypothetical protein
MMAAATCYWWHLRRLMADKDMYAATHRRSQKEGN